MDQPIPMTEASVKELLEAAGADERLACCATVKGPVTLTTTYW